MAAEFCGSCSSSCGEENDAFSFRLRGEPRIPAQNGDDQCTAAANSKLLQSGKTIDNQMVNVLLGLRPLGLKLSVPSLLSNSMEHSNQVLEPKLEDYASPHPSEKLKASNFEATLIRIGKWERRKRNEGDIITKCYFAKKKLVWEFLRGNLKSKIEIQWNEIIGIRADFQENKPGILQIELNKVPDFFEEIDPQPRKHTIWKPASDFTGGEASTFRRHYVEFPPGLLDKHYEKLLQCDQRLYELSRKPFPSLRTQYFEQHFHRYLNFSSNYRKDEPNFNLGLPLDCSSIPSPIMATHSSFNHSLFNQVSPISVMDFSPLDEHIPSFNNNVFDHHIHYGNAPLASIPPCLPYQNPNHQANPDSNMVNYIITNLADVLFTENQVATYDETYHMERVASLNAMLDPSQQIESDSSQFAQEFSHENGFVFDEHTFEGQDFINQHGSENMLMLSENNQQRNVIGRQIEVYSQPIHPPHDPSSQQAWENSTDPAAEIFCQDEFEQFNRWR